MSKKGIIFGLLILIFAFGGEYITLNMAKPKKAKGSVDTVTKISKVLAKTLAFTVKESVSDEDEIVASMLANRFLKGEETIKYGIIITNDGTILAHPDSTKILKKYSPGELKSLGPSSFLAQTAPSGLLDIAVPVKYEDKKVGEVHLGIENPEKETKNGEISPIMFIMPIILMLLAIIGIGKPDTGIKGVSPEDVKSEMEAMQESIGHLKNEESEITATIEKKKGELTEIESKIQNAQSAEEKLPDTKKEYDEVKAEVEKLNTEKSTLEDEIQKKKGEIANLKPAPTETGGAVSLDAIVQSGGKENKENKEITKRIDAKKKQEVELTQRIVAKRREEIAISARIEAKRKELLQLERKIDELKGQS